MSTNLAASPDASRQDRALTGSKQRFVITLYDAACSSLEAVADAMRAGDLGASRAALRRAEAIITHLQHTLELDQDVGQSLMTIYGFCRRQLERGRIEGDPDKIDDVRHVLGQLRDAWVGVCP